MPGLEIITQGDVEDKKRLSPLRIDLSYLQEGPFYCPPSWPSIRPSVSKEGNYHNFLLEQLLLFIKGTRGVWYVQTLMNNVFELYRTYGTEKEEALLGLILLLFLGDRDNTRER